MIHHSTIWFQPEESQGFIVNSGSFSFTTRTSSLLIRDLSLYPDIYNAALWPYVLLSWITFELNTAINKIGVGVQMSILLLSLQLSRHMFWWTVADVTFCDSKELDLKQRCSIWPAPLYLNLSDKTGKPSRIPPSINAKFLSITDMLREYCKPVCTLFLFRFPFPVQLSSDIPHFSRAGTNPSGEPHRLSYPPVSEAAGKGVPVQYLRP